jgi:hypothetical protein
MTVRSCGMIAAPPARLLTSLERIGVGKWNQRERRSRSGSLPARVPSVTGSVLILRKSGKPNVRWGLVGLSNPADVDDRTGVALEPLAQLDELRLVG